MLYFVLIKISILFVVVAVVETVWVVNVEIKFVVLESNDVVVDVDVELVVFKLKFVVL